MGEALVPGAGDAKLLGAGFGGVAGDGVEFLRGLLCAEELWIEFYGGGVGVEAAFDPDLGGAMILPVGEEADAVAAEEDLVEMMFELGEGEIFVDDLGDLEGRLEVEGGFGDDAEAAEVDDLAEEGVVVVIGVFGAGEGVEGTVGGDEFEGADDGGEVAVVAAGAMGGGGAGSDNGDVRERGEVGDGEALGVDDGGELSVGDTCADSRGAGFGVDVDGVELLEGDLGVGAVGDGVEGVAAAEGAQLVAAFDDVLDLVGGFGLVEGVGVEGEIAGPVGSRGGLVGGLFCGLLSGLLFGGREEAGEHGSSKNRARAF